MPPAIRLNIKNSQNSGIRKKGSCIMPCESTSDPIILNATRQTTAPTDRRMANQDETRITMFILILLLFRYEYCKDKPISQSRTSKDYQDNEFYTHDLLFSFYEEQPNGRSYWQERDVGSAREQRKLEAKKLLENRSCPHMSAECFVGLNELEVNTISKTQACRTYFFGINKHSLTFYNRCLFEVSRDTPC